MLLWCLWCFQEDEASRHIKAQLQSVPAAALCFCFAVLTQHGGQKALVVCPCGRWFLDIQLKQLSSYAWQIRRQADILDLIYSFWSKDHSWFSSLFFFFFNGIFAKQRWLNRVVFPMLYLTLLDFHLKYMRCPYLKCLWISRLKECLVFINVSQ